MANQPTTRPSGHRPEPTRRTPGQLGPRALRIGMRTTLLAPLLAGATVALTKDTGTRLGAFAPLFVGVALATLLPWGRIAAGPRGAPLLVTWAVVNVLVVTVAGWATEGSGSGLLPMYAILIVFFAAAFPPPARLGLLVLALAGYAVVLALSDWDPLPLALLATLAVLANFLTRELRRPIAAHRDAQVRSERRWATAAAVSAAARDLTLADPRSVL